MKNSLTDKIKMARNLLLVFGVGMAGSELNADTLNWTGGDGNWMDSTWSGGTPPPTSADTVNINNGGEVEITSLGADAYTLRLGGADSSGVVIRDEGLLTTVGASNTASAVLGYDKNQDGYLTIENGGKWSAGNSITIGRLGTGTVTVQSGGELEASGNVLLGDPNSADNSSEGTINVAGTMSVGGVFSIGNSAKGRLVIDGGNVTTTGIGYVGRNDVAAGRGDGEVSISNGTWSAASLRIGDAGTGLLSVSSGGIVTTEANVSYIGYASSGNGAVFVSDGGTLNFGSHVVVGRDGTGSLTVSGTGSVNVTGNIYLANSGVAKDGDLNIGGAVGEAAVAAGTISATQVTTASNTPDGTARLNFNHTSTSYAFNTATLISAKVQVNAYNGTTVLGRATGNSYTGGTVIHGGTLLVNNTSGSGTGTGEVQITGGTFGGSGSVTGNLLLKNGGAVAPGVALNAVGELKGVNMTWDGGGQMAFQLGATDSLLDTDRLSLSGTLTKGLATGAWHFVFTDSLSLPLTLGETYTLMTFGSQTGFDASDFSYTYIGESLPGLDGEFILTADSLQFVATAVPEPGVTGLIFFGGVLSVIAGRRLRRK